MPRVLFRLSAPPPVPGATLFLTGTHRGWSDGVEGWTFGPDGVLAAELPPGALLNVKVRALAPDGTVTEEGDAWGGRAPAHRLVVRGDTTLDLPVAGWQDGRAGRERPTRSAPPQGTLMLAAPWGEQPVRLWSPGDVEGDLPLLILHDGQNVFDEGPSFAGESWDAAGAAQALADAGFPCRLAALPVNEDRSRRYVPFAFELNSFESGADGYADWLRDALLPHLRGRFGPVPPQRVALAGSSFGGLITAYAGLRDPGTYGTLGVFSPAIWPADHAFLRWLEGRADAQARVWLDMGDHEGDTLESAAALVTLTHDLAARLRPRVAGVHLTIGEGHWHDEPAWRERLPGFLRWWLTGLQG
ncbi:alpha/beta hydrolase-fold protein [Deinococcus sp. MIMF12]|uniref:Alpha/beta hydrolase-fold protein n=1 Tax=Deinococcus rhizophilus TaxID=3049544 RepID=A0ABT7JFD0_9DEIO|nr:alpha/beta hydrolase-fold protein [Deinococcus rhizophilus]MDL2343761.1 alpha/beta hydrolase-fold protein [Deinococcus rhizophilus]